MSFLNVCAAFFSCFFLLDPPMCYATIQHHNHTYACVFTPTNETQFIDSIYEFFNKDSWTRILEYHIKFVKVSSDFDLSKRSRKDAFQPWRWFRTQGVGSSQLLLVNTYYYGLLKPFATVGIAQRDVVLSVSPSDCLDDLKDDQLDNMLRDYLLRDFDVDGATVKNPFEYSDTVEICTAVIDDVNGWGRLVYRCCGHNHQKELYWNDVYDDEWVSGLSLYILILTIIILQYIPRLIPKANRYEIFEYKPDEDNELRLTMLRTCNPEEYTGFPVIESEKMSTWSCSSNQNKLDEIGFDAKCLCNIKSVDIFVNMDNLLVEDGPTINVKKALYNAFFCKIRQTSKEDCFYSRACGINCPITWKDLARAFRTLFVMAVLVIPSLPLMYTMAADDLDFQYLSDALRDRGLKRKFNFYISGVPGKCIVAFLAVMHSLHCLLLILCKMNIRKILFEPIMKKNENKCKWSLYKISHQLRHKLRKILTKYGILALPISIVVAILFPIYVMMFIIYHAPLITITINTCKTIIGHNRPLKTQLFPVASFLLYTSVLMVLFIDIHFLLNLMSMFVVFAVLKVDLISRILPVVLLFFIYIRDTYRRVRLRYDDFFKKLLDAIKPKNMDSMDYYSIHKVVWKTKGKLGQPEKSRDSSTDTDIQFVADSVVDIPKDPDSFFLMNDRLWLKDKSISLYYTEGLFHMSEEIFFKCCNLDCPESPGPITVSFAKATLEVVRIGMFLLFVFLVVMAFGSNYYISPANHLFITLISGVLPLIIRYVFCLEEGKPIKTVNMETFVKHLKFKADKMREFWKVKSYIFGSCSKFEGSKVNFICQDMSKMKTKEDNQRADVDQIVNNDSSEPTNSVDLMQLTNIRKKEEDHPRESVEESAPLVNLDDL